MRPAALLVLVALPVASDEIPTHPAAVAERILGAALAQGGAARFAEQLSDGIGPRLAGSPGDAAAVRWALHELRRLGLEARAEKVTVPVWVRGEESARIVVPVEQRLVVTALGGSVATPPEGITGDVLMVAGIEELRGIAADRVRGKIVLFNRAIAPGFAGYSASGGARSRGPSEAARLGAVASLVRSLGTLSARLPHTGGMRYASDAPRIPAAAVAAEDADLIQRLLDRDGAVRVTLRLGCETRPDAESANVIAELPGRERPEEIVLIGAHLDSWDLGTGAIDDAAGVGIVMDTLRILKSQGPVPRRTLRAVLFANEENGLRGARSYAEEHAPELPRHVAAMEADAGGGRPVGLAVEAGPGGLERMTQIAGLFPLLVAPRIVEREAGADIGRLAAGRVPRVGLLQEDANYFDWHHTPADTFDKIDPRALAESAAFFAIVAYALAEHPGTLARPEPPAKPEP